MILLQQIPITEPVLNRDQLKSNHPARCHSERSEESLILSPRIWVPHLGAGTSVRLSTLSFPLTQRPRPSVNNVSTRGHMQAEPLATISVAVAGMHLRVPPPSHFEGWVRSARQSPESALRSKREFRMGLVLLFQKRVEDIANLGWLLKPWEVTSAIDEFKSYILKGHARFVCHERV
jgi:hypothetical protein